jgi:hypothetical protein
MESLVEGIEAQWRTDFENRDLDGFGAQRAKTFAELAGLVCGARDQNAAARKR